MLPLLDWLKMKRREIIIKTKKPSDNSILEHFWKSKVNFLKII